MKQVFKLLFHKYVRQAFLLGILAAIAVLGYLHWWGMPEWIKNAVLGELSDRGIHANIGSLTFDPWRGLVAEDVSVRIPGSDEVYLDANEIRFEIDLGALLRGKVAVKDLEFSDSAFAMEVAEEGGGKVPLVVRQVNGIFAFDAEQTLIIKDLQFNFLGVAFEVKGSLGTKRTGPRPEKTERKPIVLKKSWVDALRELQEVRTTHPLVVEIELGGDIRNRKTLSIMMKLRGQDVRYDGVTITRARGAVSYRNEMIEVDHLALETPHGIVDLQGRYELATKNSAFELGCDGKPEMIRMFLPKNKRKYLEGLEATEDFSLVVSGRVPGGDLAGAEGAMEFHGSGLSFRGVAFRDVRVKGMWKDDVLTLSEVGLTREEGNFSATFSWNRASDECKFLVNSTINLDELEPIFPEKSRNLFKTFTLTKAPVIQLSGSRQLKDADTLKANGSVEIKDFTGNEIPIKSFRCKIAVVGPVIRFNKVDCRKKEGRLTGDFALNLKTGDLEIQAKSDVYPVEIATIIGPRTKRDLESYHFLTPPKITWKGVYNVKHPGLNDLNIDVTCAKFNWWKVNLTDVKAHVWIGPQSIEVSNLVSSYYGGTLKADLVVDITGKDSKVGFHIDLDKVDFKPFNEDVFGYKDVAGKLTGNAWAAGVTGKEKTWVGDGWLKIEDGELWKIPIFGGLSKALGTIIPGFGSPKARYAESKFVLQDAQAKMYDIKIDSLVVTLTARGTYYFDERLDFVVQGHLLRKLFFIGWFLDPITKIAEMRLTGTLKKWEWNTAYIPGL